MKGVSGSGKSTRAFFLLKFLEQKCGFETVDFTFTNFENKEKSIGVLVKELDLVFLGKRYLTNGFERFQGYDVTTGYFGKSSYLSDYLRDNKDNYNYIVEGAGVTATNRLRPLFLREYCGFTNIMMQYYNYGMDQKDKYLERLVYRSGKEPKIGTMWEKCDGFIADHKKSEDEIKALRINEPELNMMAFYNLFDTPAYDFGMKMLAFLDMDEFVMPFLNYCQESTYLTDNSFNNFGDDSKK